MISLHTNISALTTQRSMTTSTTKLNQAIERLSTGSKINHAADNAANYSISTNMNTQLSAHDVAADNIAMGMDLLSVAQDTIAGMQDRGSRIHALITQARNGTYGTDSLNAMAQEAGALVSEINRLYNNTEYNGIKLFDNVVLPDWAQEVKNTAGKVDGKSLEELALSHNGFIQEVVEETPEVTITNPDELEDAISTNTKIGIGNAQTLAKLAELVNDGTATCSGKTIILTNDIDLSAYQEGEGWEPIGYYNSNSDKKAFEGTFNGNGHKITNLKIDRDAKYQGLFGFINGDIKNIGVSGNIKGNQSVGILVGRSGPGNVNNCYSTGYVESSNGLCGGLFGVTYENISNCYSECDVYSTGSSVGGLVGAENNPNMTIENCYATGNVKTDATGNSIAGGLIGKIVTRCSILNCHATGDVTSRGNYVGGLVGQTFANEISYSYATGNVTGENSVGGLLGLNGSNVNNCYSVGNVFGGDNIGGIGGESAESVQNCYAIGFVKGTGENVDDIIGDNAGGTLTNCWAFKYKSTSLQVGIYSDEDSQINVDTNLKLNLSISNLTSDSAYNNISDFLNLLSQKATELGAAQNRLESAHESNMVQMDNLTSSLSTIRDADISEVSSDFIRQQILQQACATLMSTANQSPSIALQLL